MRRVNVKDLRVGDHLINNGKITHLDISPTYVRVFTAEMGDLAFQFWPQEFIQIEEVT